MIDQEEDKREKFRAMWTPDGDPLKTMENIMDYIFKRFNAHMSQIQAATK